MKTFTIEKETCNITVHATKREAANVADAQLFGSAEDLAALAADWPAAETRRRLTAGAAVGLPARSNVTRYSVPGTVANGSR